MTRLLLVRHGESTANRDRLVPGRSLDAALTELGAGQARQAAARVAGMVTGPVPVISSDALRARQTAAVVAERIGSTVETTELLREQYLGDLEGRPVSELSPSAVPAGFDISEVGWGGGESIARVHIRMHKLLDEMQERPATADTLVLIGHGHAMSVLLAVLAGRDHRHVDWIADALPLGGVREVDWDPGQIW